MRRAMGTDQSLREQLSTRLIGLLLTPAMTGIELERRHACSCGARVACAVLPRVQVRDGEGIVFLVG
jgi:hypothetical protein